LERNRKIIRDALHSRPQLAGGFALPNRK
jgi:hypothetical protein